MKVFYSLLGVQLFERLSYYSLASCLVLFSINYMHCGDASACAIYALFFSISYFVPIVSGVLADKLFGSKKLIFIGLSFIMFGNFLILFSYLYSTLFFFGLAFVCSGVGAFKSNVNNLVGEYYANDMKEKYKAFTMLQVAANIGATTSAVVAGIMVHYSWFLSFFCNLIFTLISLILFFKTNRLLGTIGSVRNEIFLSKKIWGVSYCSYIIFVLIACVTFFGYAFFNSAFYIERLNYVLIAILIYFVYELWHAKYADKRRMLAAFILIISTVMCFIVHMQIGSLFMLFFERCVNHKVLLHNFSFTVSAVVSQGINPITIVIAGMFLSRCSNVQFKLTRFFLGLSCSALTLWVLYLGCLNLDAEKLVPLYYFVFSIVILGFSELLVMPFINSNVNKLAPEKYKGLMMGLVMVSIACASMMGKYIGEWLALPNMQEKVDVALVLQVYSTAFKKLAIWNIYFILAILPLFYFVRIVLKEIEE